MSHRELALSVLRGEEEDIIPFFPDISEWYKIKRLPIERVNEVPPGSFISDDESLHKDNFGMPEKFADWTYLDFYRNFNWGLPVHIYDWYHFEYENCEYMVEDQGKRIFRRFKTPIGQIEHVDGVSNDGSWCPMSHFAKTDGDWKVLAYVVEHTKPVANYKRIQEILDGIGQLGIADAVILRSPFGKLVQNYAGLEAIAYKLVDDSKFIDDFLTLQEEKDLELIRLAADSPAELVIISDHADEHLISPAWYEQYCVPYYQKANKILHDKGKFVSTHLDGSFKGLFELVKQTGFDLLDGCTPAPMSNYEVEELPQALGLGMTAFCGVPNTFFVQDTNTEDIINYARRIIKAILPHLILNIGDVLPTNGDIQKTIELGKWVNDLNAGKQRL